jgi:hypothetical protein
MPPPIKNLAFASLRRGRSARPDRCSRYNSLPFPNCFPTRLRPTQALNLRTAISFPRAPWRMPTALVVSLAVHAVLLSIAVGGQAFGLPGLTLPWKERRVGADDLRIELAPAPVAPAAPPAPVAPLAPVAAPHNVLPPAPLPAAVAAVAAVAPPPAPTAASAPMRAVPPSAPEASQPDPAVELARVERDAQNAQLLRETELIAIARREAVRQEEVVRAEEAARAVARAELERQDDLRRAALQQERAAEQTREQENQAALALAEAGRRDAVRQEQARQAQAEEAKQASARAEQARQQEVERQAQQEQARQEQAKQELARQQQARQEQARQEQARQEQARQELAKQELAKQEQAKQEQARQEQARQELAKQELARQALAKQAQAKPDQAQRERAEQEAQREERLRAIGRQLNAEAAQRDAAAGSPSRSLLPGVSSLRRGWLLGRADANAQLVQYAETMGQKIELNMTFDMVRDVVKQPHVAPIVTMAIRADGSVEKVTFEVSSGVPAIDAAIRRVIASQAPYAAFPPALARQYDVVEIRRTWNFDTAIRLQ